MVHKGCIVGIIGWVCTYLDTKDGPWCGLSMGGVVVGVL